MDAKRAAASPRPVQQHRASSEMLDLILAQLRVIRSIQPERACRCCGTLQQAPASERLLTGGLATPGVIAYMLVSRHCERLPLFRQSRIFVRHGVGDQPLDPVWLGRCGLLVAGGVAPAPGCVCHVPWSGFC